MFINSNYVLLKKVSEPVAEGFQAVEVQDDFIVKGEIIKLPDEPKYLDSHVLSVGEHVLFMKYSPDTIEVELPHDIGTTPKGEKVKFVRAVDLLAVI